MTQLQSFLTHGYKFAFGIGSPAALSKPLDGRMPKYIAFTSPSSFNIRFKVLVGSERRFTHKLLVVFHFGEVVLLAEFSIFGIAD